MSWGLKNHGRHCSLNWQWVSSTPSTGLFIIVGRSYRLYTERTAASYLRPQQIMTIPIKYILFVSTDPRNRVAFSTVYLNMTFYSASLVFRILATCQNNSRSRSHPVSSLHKPLFHPDNFPSSRSCNVEDRISQFPKSFTLVSPSSAESSRLHTLSLHYTSVRWHRRAHQHQDRLGTLSICHCHRPGYSKLSHSTGLYHCSECPPIQ